MVVWCLYRFDSVNEVVCELQFVSGLGFENAIEVFGKLVSRDPQNESMGCLVTRENNILRTTVYGKPAHTDK